jgi:hypothetical protein
MTASAVFIFFSDVFLFFSAVFLFFAAVFLLPAVFFFSSTPTGAVRAPPGPAPSPEVRGLSGAASPGARIIKY